MLASPSPPVERESMEEDDLVPSIDLVDSNSYLGDPIVYQ